MLKKKLAPKKVKICPGCPAKELSLDITPQFNFVDGKQESTKKITVVDSSRKKTNTKIKSLF